MAQPNVAREPSMDEILASIRRIIESNEAQPEFVAEVRAESSFPMIRGGKDDLLDDPAIVEAFHERETQPVADIEPLHRPEPSMETSTPQPALSLADVAARVRAASERQMASRLQSQDHPAATVTPAEPAADAEPDLGSGEPPVPESSIAVDLAAPEEASGDAVALISPAAGERVAQSFGALAEALDAGSRRSFDEIAQDMLRPMLQEWLDDNLPTLVERLVREEIERVARGPRR